MIKYLKMIGNVLLYGGIYFLVNVTISFVFIISTVLTNLDKIDNLNFFIQSIAKGTQIILVISGIISLMAYFFIMKLKKKSLISYCNFSIPNLSNVVILIALAASFTILSTIAIEITKIYKKFPETIESMSNLIMGSNVIISLLIVGIFVPIVEEVIFRGLIFNELKNNFITCIYLGKIFMGTNYYSCC